MEGNFTLYDNLILSDVFSRREGGYGIYGDHFLLLETELKDKNQIRYLNSTYIIENADITKSKCKADIDVDFKYYCLMLYGNQLISVEINYLPLIYKFQFKKKSSAFPDYDSIYAYSTSKVDFAISPDSLLQTPKTIRLLLFNIEVNNNQSGVYGEISFLREGKWNIHNNSLIIVNKTNDIRNLMILDVSQFIPESK